MVASSKETKAVDDAPEYTTGSKANVENKENDKYVSYQLAEKEAAVCPNLKTVIDKQMQDLNKAYQEIDALKLQRCSSRDPKLGVWDRCEGNSSGNSCSCPG